METSPITDTDLAKRTVFQRSYSVVASEYDKQHSILPARVKAIPRRRVNSGDAGKSTEIRSRRKNIQGYGTGCAVLGNCRQIGFFVTTCNGFYFCLLINVISLLIHTELA